MSTSYLWVSTFSLDLTCFYLGVVCSHPDTLIRLSAHRGAAWHWSTVTWCLGQGFNSSSYFIVIFSLSLRIIGLALSRTFCTTSTTQTNIARYVQPSNHHMYLHILMLIKTIFTIYKNKISYLFFIFNRLSCND